MSTQHSIGTTEQPANYIDVTDLDDGEVIEVEGVRKVTGRDGVFAVTLFDGRELVVDEAVHGIDVPGDLLENRRFYGHVDVDGWKGMTFIHLVPEGEDPVPVYDRDLLAE